jgi:ribosomal protein S18 acetylase RimI-like enzyme
MAHANGRRRLWYDNRLSFVTRPKTGRKTTVMPTIEYAFDDRISVADFVDLLERSTLAARRPVDDPTALQGMLDHTNLLVTARSAGQLVGLSRSVTDFHFCCYLSDLAVDADLQRQGIGKELMRLTQSRLGPRCTLILLAAPAAVEYYSHVGFEHHPQAWVLKPGAALT